MIRKAIKKDIPKILDLLKQVCLVHYNGRPDIFKVGTKYSAKELKVILKDKTRPIFTLFTLYQYCSFSLGKSQFFTSSM